MPIDKEQKKELEELILRTIENYGLLSDFERNTVATPIDSYSVINRRFVTSNGTVANRPKSSVATVGQPYFATDTAIPMTFSIEGWRNGVGSVVAGHR